jgi:zinc transport system permease protein
MSGAGFFESFALWRDAVAAAAISGAALGFLGVWVVLKRMVYVPLALTQVSSAGVIAAFLLPAGLAGALGEHPGGAGSCDPAGFALLFPRAAAALCARARRESVNGVAVAYLVSAAAVLLLGGFVRQDLHDINGVLFGSAVLVETRQVFYLLAAGLLVAFVHAFQYRRFLFVSFDPDAAGAAGLGRFFHEALLIGSMALMLSVATRAIGALPAFGFSILPALGALRLARSMRTAFVLATAAGVAAAAGGYYLSFVLELPTGASMVLLCALLSLALALAGRRAAED